MNQRQRVLARRRREDHREDQKANDIPPEIWEASAEYSRAVMNIIDMMPPAMKSVAHETGQINDACRRCPKELAVLMQNPKFMRACAALQRLNEKINNS